MEGGEASSQDQGKTTAVGQKRFALDLVVGLAESSESVEEAFSGPKEGLQVFKGVDAYRSRERYEFWSKIAHEEMIARGEVEEEALPLEQLVFNVGKFLDTTCLRTQKHGRVLLYSHAMPSTQTLLFEHGTSLPAGSVCLTDIQTSGKGRGSNEWTSPPGALLFSFISEVKDGKTLPLLQYIACLAIVEAIKSIAGFEEVDIGIKWPNDIYADKSVKIGGILCQSIVKNGSFAVVIGIGVNVDNNRPTTCLNAMQAGGNPVSRELLLARMLERFEALHLEFEDPTRGFSPRIQAEYERRWLHSGQQVTLEGEGGRRAIIQGVSPASGGCLVAKAVDGDQATFELYPDGNRLDFFQGLISKKISPHQV